MADREAWYGDRPRDVPLDALLVGPYNAARRALIGEEASHELRPAARTAAPRAAAAAACPARAAVGSRRRRR